MKFGVSYHNEIHGFDVAQMTYFVLNGEDGYKVLLQLTPMDELATLFAAYCHDYMHDGFNNCYHKAIQSERFKEHGEEGTQEKFHFAESWKVVEQTGMLDTMPGGKKEKLAFKRRMQRCILATDMS